MNVDPIGETYTDIYELSNSTRVDGSDPPVFRGSVIKETEITVLARNRKALEKLQADLRKRGYRRTR